MESSSSDEDGSKKKRKAKKLKKSIPKAIQKRLERYLNRKMEDVKAAAQKEQDQRNVDKDKKDHLCLHMFSPYNNNVDMKHLVGPRGPTQTTGLRKCPKL